MNDHVKPAPPAPGVYRNMPEDHYHARELGAWGSSTIKTICKQTLAHAYAKHVDPEREEKENANLDMGHAYHTLVLEPENFKERFIIEPDMADTEGAIDGVNNLKAHCKALELKVGGTKIELARRLRDEGGMDPNRIWPLVMEAFYVTAGKRTILNAKQGKALLGMGKAIRDHKPATEILAGGESEVSFFWEDKETGLLLKCRADRYRPKVLAADLKSTISAAQWKFQRLAIDFQYHVQSAMYLDGIRHAADDDLGDNFWFIAQEKENPWAVSACYCEPELLEHGYNEYRRGVRLLANALDKNEWPAYDPEPWGLAMPGWLKRKAEFAAERGLDINSIDVEEFTAEEITL